MRPLKHLALFIAYGIAVAVFAIVGYVAYLQSRADLRPWHLVHLDAEFTASKADEVRTLDDYRRLEERLFQQLRTAVYEKTAPRDRSIINRYWAGSLADPTGYPRNWNRTFSWHRWRAGACCCSTACPIRRIRCEPSASDCTFSVSTWSGSACRVTGLRLLASPTRLGGFRRRHPAGCAPPARPHRPGRAPLPHRLFERRRARRRVCARRASRARTCHGWMGWFSSPPPIGDSAAPQRSLHGQAQIAKVPGLEKARVETTLEPEYDPYKYNVLRGERRRPGLAAHPRHRPSA